MKKVESYLKERYGEGGEVKVEFEGKEITGVMYGDDECFEMNDFYQYLLTKDTLYKAFYEIPNDNDDLGSLDYENPTGLEDVTEYYKEYVV